MCVVYKALVGKIRKIGIPIMQNRYTNNAVVYTKTGSEKNRYTNNAK